MKRETKNMLVSSGNSKNIIIDEKQGCSETEQNKAL